MTVSHLGPRMRRREFLTVGLALSVWPSAPRLAFAQSRYPDRPIRLVIRLLPVEDTTPSAARGRRG